MNFPSSEPQDLLTEHLLTHPHALGFVGVGIGKTAATLAAYAKLVASGESKGALVIAPMRVANLTWPLEIQRWADFNWMRIANLRQDSGKRAFLQGTAHLYVCNFESIPTLLHLIKSRKQTYGSIPYDTLIIDECFAAGTLVDTPEGKKPIEKVKKGDCVFNAVGVGFVTHVHLNQPKRIARVRINGQDIWCSDTHKFFTSEGWRSAGSLKAGETTVATHTESVRLVWSNLPAEGAQQREQDSVLREKMLCKSSGSKTKTGGHFSSENHDGLRLVWEAFSKVQRQTFLQQELLCEVEDAVGPQTSVDRGTESKSVIEPEKVLPRRLRVLHSCKRAYSLFKSYAKRFFSGAVERHTEENQAQASRARRERQTGFRSSASSVQHNQSLRSGGVGDGVHFCDSRNNSFRASTEPLQAGPRMRESETEHRGRWLHTQVEDHQTEGQKEDGSFGFKRVESVEVYESTDPRLDRFRTADGLIHFYDLSVSGHPSYSVNGLLVHNCTKLKNPSAKRPNAYRREVPHSEHKRIWALTGTPTPNSLLDLFAQVRFVDGGQRLGRAFDLFKQAYFKPSGYGGYKWKELPGSKDLIEQRIHDITLTLRSQDWLDIPDTVVEDVEISLPPKLMADYKAFEKELVLQIRKDKEITATNAAALVSKLLQFTSGSLYDEDKRWHDIHELKLDALEKIVKEVKSPILVAYAFQHEAHRLRDKFPQAKFFSDAKNATSQTQLLADWNAKKIPILVAHPKSVGHGLNMQHGGNTLVWMSLTYSREDYEQMIARLSRRGQDAVVNVYRLMCQDTVDYAVATVVEEKKAVEDRLLTALQLLESFRGVPLPKMKREPEEVDWI